MRRRRVVRAPARTRRRTRGGAGRPTDEGGRGKDDAYDSRRDVIRHRDRERGKARQGRACEQERVVGGAAASQALGPGRARMKSCRTRRRQDATGSETSSSTASGRPAESSTRLVRNEWSSARRTWDGSRSGIILIALLASGRRWRSGVDRRLTPVNRWRRRADLGRWGLWSPPHVTRHRRRWWIPVALLLGGSTLARQPVPVLGR